MIVNPGRLNAGLHHPSRIEIGEEPSSFEEGLLDRHLFAVRIVDNHFANIIQFLTMGTTLEGYYTQQKKELVVQNADFAIIVGHLCKMGSYEILHRYVLDFEGASILAESDGGVVGGHYSGKVTV